MAYAPLLTVAAIVMQARWRAHTGERVAPARSGHTAAADGRGRCILFGGYAERAPGEMRDVVNDLWVHDADGWARVQDACARDECADRPGPRLASASAVLGDELLLFGGWDPQTPGTGGEILDDVWSLDLSTLAWSRCEPMPRGPTSRHAAAVVASGAGTEPELIVHTHRCAEAVLKWDPRLRKLTEQRTTGEAPASRGLHVAVPLGADLLVFGGADKSGAMRDDAYALDTSTWHWRALNAANSAAHRPSARAGACAAALDGRTALFFGGAERAPDNAGLIPRDDTWTLSMPSATWTKVSPAEADDTAPVELACGIAPGPRNAASLCALREGELLLHGGWVPFVSTYDDTHTLEIER